MSEAAAVRDAIKRQLKQRGMTYADLGRALGLSEPTIKRQLSRGGITLERLERIGQVLDTDLHELIRIGTRSRELPTRLSIAQERALADDARLLLVFHLLCNDWPAERIRRCHGLADTEMVLLLARLDRLALIELLPGDRTRLKVARGFAWRSNGPVLRRHGRAAIEEFMRGRFGRDRAVLRLEARELSADSLARLLRRLEKVGQEFLDLAESDSLLPGDRRQSVGLVLALRPWRFSLMDALGPALEETAGRGH